MILRFASREGQFRLTVEPDAEIASILPEILDKLPNTVIPSSITISPKPQGADSRPIASLKQVTFRRLGLK
jgi:nuclear protein localization family protein 4